jgi:hypothetical protein
MMRLTLEQEAAYALDYGVSRADLKPVVQAEYDRLLTERRAHPRVRAAPDQTGLETIGWRPVDTRSRKRPAKTPGFDPGKTDTTYAWIMMSLAVLAMLTFVVMVFIINTR